MTAEPDTGSTPYADPPLPLLELTDEVCDILDAWIRLQAGNGDPGEGPPAWEELIRRIAQLRPEAVVDELDDSDE